MKVYPLIITVVIARMKKIALKAIVMRNKVFSITPPSGEDPACIGAGQAAQACAFALQNNADDQRN